ncbi:hypothetical protein EON65_48150 [archaeon]|nr:MAG: hypothetical protein EON65_48150 [archaeon]
MQHRQLEEPAKTSQGKRSSLNIDTSDPSATSVFGYLFGSSGGGGGVEKGGSTREVEMDSFRASQINPLMKVIDLSKERLPTGKNILYACVHGKRVAVSLRTCMRVNMDVLV